MSSWQMTHNRKKEWEYFDDKKILQPILAKAQDGHWIFLLRTFICQGWERKQNSTWFYFHTVNDTFQAISKDVSYDGMIRGHDLEDRSFIWLVWGGRSCLEKINRTSRLLGEKGNQTFCSVEVFIKLLKLPFHHNQLTIITIMSAEIFIKLLKLSFPDRPNCIINAKKDGGVIFSALEVFRRLQWSGRRNDSDALPAADVWFGINVSMHCQLYGLGSINV